MKIANSTILVTGANRGIGLALVEKALEKGAAKVYATYRSESNRSTLEALGERVVPIHLDLSNQATIADLSQSVPSLDILINNAGIFTAADVLENTGEQLRNDVETNFFGTLSVTKAVLPALKKAGSGAIANISSIAGLAAMPSFGGYSASKAALHSLTQSIRGKLKANGISVHGAYPGPVATRMTEGMQMDTTPAPVVADNILTNIENGVEEIFPDGMSQQVGPLFFTSPKQLEQNFAAF
ncbi:SDR family oxidoreductase [Rubellicoccus peritrichatus]|uniref:SDR family oxidoreductase n=1 Tax=Rubellicoccus peritrichatus TaxID=3080537 RepID=A0AAQ3LDR0_9BACT|nr:SDR family oxidoreductase [Puniceicoccus sp. CR14]WOO40249.1 SDR family oxidoreductase [Puniceicoccus sp. CR14]